MTPCTIPILMYHEINRPSKGDSEKFYIHPSYCLSVEKFEEQMRFLSENHVIPLSITDMLSMPAHQDNIRRKSVVITFDDGHLGNYIYAFPILRKYGFTATFFVTTDFIGTSNMMEWSHLRDLSSGGMSVQSHGVSHAPLSSLQTDHLARELILSKSRLESEVGSPVSYLSLPHGDYDKRVEPLAKRVGYRAIFTSDVDYYNLMKPVYLSGRLEIRNEHTFKYFISIINGKPLGFKFNRSLRKIKSFCRFLLGINNYRRVYRFLNGIKYINDR